MFVAVEARGRSLSVVFLREKKTCFQDRRNKGGGSQKVLKYRLFPDTVFVLEVISAAGDFFIFYTWFRSDFAVKDDDFQRNEEIRSVIFLRSESLIWPKQGGRGLKKYH